MNAVEIHQRIGSNWPAVLVQLGIPETALRNKHGPCPACGGKDRFRFDNKGRGSFYCNGCGAGDGFALLIRVRGWSFAEARREVLRAAGISHGEPISQPTAVRLVTSETIVARPTTRVRSLLRSTCALADCDDAFAYLQHRGLWPPPIGCTLRAHPSVEYFEDGRRVGRYAALIAIVRNDVDQVITAHVTYIAGGRKLDTAAPRKLLSPLTGHNGCAVRLMPLEGYTLGIAEGIETALAAHHLHQVPTWSAINTALLMKFEPPQRVRKLIIFADNDPAGLLAAARLMERMQDRITVQLHVPPQPFKDFNDQLVHRYEQ